MRLAVGGTDLDALSEPLSKRQGSDFTLPPPLFHTKDLEEARNGVGKVFCPHDLKLVGPDVSVNTIMYHAPLKCISLNRLRYGATVAIDADRLKTFHLVMMPISGSADARCGKERILSTPALASVISPTLPYCETIYRDCDRLLIQIKRSLLERICAQHLGHDLRDPIEFHLGMDMANARCAGWRALVNYLTTEFDNQPYKLSSPLLCSQIEHLVVTTLLMGQPHNYTTELMQPSPPLAPSHVKRVEEYIASHMDQPLTVGELAAHAGVSVSALFMGFRNFRKTTPMAYLKSVRLQRVREELQRSSIGAETVTNIATRWGFGHLGHFTSDYKRKFGESPSETLRN